MQLKRRRRERGARDASSRGPLPASTNESVQKLLDMALLDLTESKQKETAALEEKEILLQEKEFLKEKLTIHLDLWDVDKRQLEENMILVKREYECKDVVQSFEIASLNLSVGFHQQESLKLKLRLEGALDELDYLQSRVRVIDLQHKLKQDELNAAKKNISEEAFLSAKNLETSRAAWEMNTMMEKAEKAQSFRRTLDELQKKHLAEVEKLRFEQHKLSSKHENEMLPLIRERNFVWEQFKRMEDDYSNRLKARGELLEAAHKEIDKLKLLVEELQKAHEEKAVEITVLKINVQETEEEVRKLRVELSNLNDVVNGLEQSGQASKLLTNCVHEDTTGIAIISRGPESHTGYTGQVLATNDHNEHEQHNMPVKSEAFVLGKEGHTKKLDNISIYTNGTRSFVRSKEDELKKASITIEELRHENENLRMLYAELEAQIRDRRQAKSSKANCKTVKDTSTRNLNAELNAVVEGSIVDAEADAGYQLRPRRAKLAENSSVSTLKQKSGTKSKENEPCGNITTDREMRKLVSLSATPNLTETPNLKTARKSQLRHHVDPPALSSVDNDSARKRGRRNRSEGQVLQCLDLAQSSQTMATAQNTISAKNFAIQSWKEHHLTRTNLNLENFREVSFARHTYAHKDDKVVLRPWLTVQPTKRRFFATDFSIPKVVRTVPSSAMR